MRDALKWIGAPGSFGFLAAAVVLGVVMRYVWPRRAALARMWLVALGCTYLVLALPPVAHGLGDSLGRLAPHSIIDRPDVVILLDGDSPHGRIRATKQAHDWWRTTPVIVLGPDWLSADLVRRGVPPNLVQSEAGPATTLEQLEWIRAYLAARPGTAATLVASRVQMPRVAALVDTMGFEVQLIPSYVDGEPPRRGLRQWIPSYRALRLARDAVYEHAALIYYRHRKWIAGASERERARASRTPHHTAGGVETSLESGSHLDPRFETKVAGQGDNGASHEAAHGATARERR
jgi:uncharacterized SAM-binding protein YcdF (DUF218 family)